MLKLLQIPNKILLQIMELLDWNRQKALTLQLKLSHTSRVGIALIIAAIIIVPTIQYVFPWISNVFGAVQSIRPNGDGTVGVGWVTSGGGSTSLYAEADDDPDSPNDSDYIKSANRTDTIMYLQLDDLPVNFASATSVEIKARHRENGVGNDRAALTYQIVESNESTAITAATSATLLADNGSFVTDTYTPSITGTNTKASWDGARLKITYDNQPAQSPDDAPANISAIEVNITYSPLSTVTQSSYRLYANANSTDVGSALAAQDTGATLASPNLAFRLRTSLHVDEAALSTSGKTFKLQYAGKGTGTCASPSGTPGTYTDVTTSTTIAFNNNATPSDGASLTDNANDPVHSGHTNVNQTYEELNNFTNSVAAISIGEDGLWDFALKDNGAPGGSTYCLRIVESDGTLLYSYTTYPEVTSTPPAITQRAYIFEYDDGANVNNNTDITTANTALTSVKIGERLIARIQIDYPDATTLSGNTYQLYFDTNDGNFTPVKAGAAIAPASGASGNTGDSLTAAAAGTCTGGSSFVNGLWQEVTATTRPFSLAQNNCTEFGFAIDTSLAAAATTYRLQLRRDGAVLATYNQYPTLTTVSAANNLIRASKDNVVKFANCTDTTWGCETVDSSVDAGSLWTSLAIDHSGNPWISYYDATNTDLKVANYVGSGGNCTSTAWNCERVDISGATTGSNSSIGVDPKGRVWVSYRDASNDLKIAVNYDHPSFSACSASGWDCIVVENTASNLGFESSIAFDASGNPWISYNDSTANAVRVAWLVGSGGNCTSTAWSCEEVDALGSNALDGDYSSITFDSQGYAWLSYYDGVNSALKVATTSSSFGSTCTSSRWNCAIVDNSAAVGEYESIAINPSTDKPWVVYQDLTNSTIRYAVLVGSGGNCTSTAWDCAQVSDSQGVGFDPSLAFGPDGKAWFNFFKNTGASTRDLRIAKYVGSGGTGCSSAAWQCNTIDSQTGSTGEYGSDKALKFDSSGTGWVAYRNNTNTSLKIAKTTLPHFSNSLRYRLDGLGYTNIAGTNAVFDQLAATTSTPIYNFTSLFDANTANIGPTWIGQSTVAASTNNIKFQIYRGGSTNAWVDMATESSCSANVNCTITPSAITTNLSDYYIAEGSKYALNFRVYQVAGTSKTFKTECFQGAAGGASNSTNPPLSQRLRHGRSLVESVLKSFFLPDATGGGSSC